MRSEVKNHRATGLLIWASYLVNGDKSGLTPSELTEAKDWVSEQMQGGWTIGHVDVARDETGEPLSSRVDRIIIASVPLLAEVIDYDLTLCDQHLVEHHDSQDNRV